VTVRSPISVAGAAYHAIRPALLCILLAAIATSVNSQPAPSEKVSTRSVSGQFIIYDQRAPDPSPLAAWAETNLSMVRLDPTLLTISCERIKQDLCHDLGSTSPWRGRVLLALRSANDADEPITVTSEKFNDNWQYRIELADIASRARYIRAMVEVVLLEMANRNAGARSAELPLWLSEGFTQQLLASKQIEIILPPPRPGANGLAMVSRVVNARRENPLEHARQQLREHELLTFEDLSWPADDQLTGENREVYQLSSQLLVSELLHLKNGPACLRAMLDQLPQVYNWQFAFLRAFAPFFQRPLDIEKWWTLHLVQFTGREVAQRWPLEESWLKLEAAVNPPVEVRAEMNELPLHTAVPLQIIVREWDPARQTPALKYKLRELEMLRLRTAPPLLGLVDEYHQTVDRFLQHRDQTGLLHRLHRGADLKRATEEAVKQLDALEARRLAARPAHETITAAQPPSPTDQGGAEP
jgi:hypothetical protein